MSPSGHRHADRERVRAALITVSDTRGADDDASGAMMRRLVERAGHEVVDQRLLPDEPARVAAAVRDLAARDDCDAVLLTGGTGIAPRDVTYEAVAGLLTKRLDGFGELFRRLSYDEVGPAAMLSRAVAGAVGSCFVALMPGSPSAVELALGRLLLPEIGHIVGLLRPGRLDTV